MIHSGTFPVVRGERFYTVMSLRYTAEPYSDRPMIRDMPLRETNIAPTTQFPAVVPSPTQ